VRRPPLWPFAAVVFFVLVWLVSTIYLALALAICIGVLMLVYWAFTQLPVRLGWVPDQRQREIETKRRRSR
jgi:hypothetical protein